MIVGNISNKSDTRDSIGPWNPIDMTDMALLNDLVGEPLLSALSGCAVEMPEACSESGANDVPFLEARAPGGAFDLRRDLALLLLKLGFLDARLEGGF
jgi:hypothetical protein